MLQFTHSTTCLALTLALQALTTSACNRATAAYEKPLTPVRVQAAQNYLPTGAEGAGTRYSATIKPSAQLELSFKSGGYVTELLQLRGATGQRPVQEGDGVGKGTVLARLRANEFSNKVKAAEAQISEAQAALAANQAQISEAESAAKQAQRDFERATLLLEANSLTRPEHEAVRTKYAVAQAKLAAACAQAQVIQARSNSAQTALAETQLAQSDAVMRAPFAGFVLRRNVEIGTLVTPGAPILSITAAGEVKAVFGVPDVTVANLRTGTALLLSAEALPGLEFKRPEQAGQLHHRARHRRQT